MKLPFAYPTPSRLAPPVNKAGVTVLVTFPFGRSVVLDAGRVLPAVLLPESVITGTAVARMVVLDTSVTGTILTGVTGKMANVNGGVTAVSRRHQLRLTIKLKNKEEGAQFFSI